MRRRVAFVSQTATRGGQWAWEVLSHVGTLLGLLALLGGLTLVGLLIDQPWWLVGGAFALFGLVTLGEGAYRAWDHADRESTRSGVGANDPRVVLAKRLDEFAQDARLILEEVSADPARAENARASYNHLVADVQRELRKQAPGFLSYFLEDPAEDMSSLPLADGMRLVLTTTTDQLANISAWLRDGEAKPPPRLVLADRLAQELGALREL